MDALDDEHRVAAQLQLLAVVLALACHEVVFGHLDALALHQPEQVVFEQTVFHGLDVVEVVVAVGQPGGVGTVHEIVIGGERHGP